MRCCVFTQRCVLLCVMSAQTCISIDCTGQMSEMCNRVQETERRQMLFVWGGGSVGAADVLSCPTAAPRVSWLPPIKARSTYGVKETCLFLVHKSGSNYQTTYANLWMLTKTVSIQRLLKKCSFWTVYSHFQKVPAACTTHCRLALVPQPVSRRLQRVLNSLLQLSAATLSWWTTAWKQLHTNFKKKSIILLVLWVLKIKHGIHYLSQSLNNSSSNSCHVHIQRLCNQMCCCCFVF